MKYNKSRSLALSLRYAFSGIRHTLKAERNFKIHCVCGAAAIISTIMLPVDTLHTFMVIYAIFSVLCLELINTAVEALTDLYCGESLTALAKIAKDCAAGAVLLASLQAVLIAILVARHIIYRV